MIIGIDASHTVAGGAISHLKNLLTNVNFNKYSIQYIYVWAPKNTLSLLPRNKYIIYKDHFLFVTEAHDRPTHFQLLVEHTIVLY